MSADIFQKTQDVIGGRDGRVPKVGGSIKKGHLMSLHPIKQQNLKVLKEMKSIGNRYKFSEIFGNSEIRSEISEE